MYINKIICGCARVNITRGILKLANYKTIFLKDQATRLAVSPKRNIGQTSTRFTFKNNVQYPQLEKKWRIMDKVPEGYELVYKTPRESRYLTFVSTFTVGSSAILLLCTVFDYMFRDRTKEREFDPIQLTETEIFARNWSEYYIFAGIFTFLAIGVMTIAGRYVQRIYRKGDDFIAIYTECLPGLRKTLAFRSGEAKYIPVKYGLLPWSNTLFKLKNKKSIIVEDRFRTFRDLSVMLAGKLPGTYHDHNDDEDN